MNNKITRTKKRRKPIETFNKKFIRALDVINYKNRQIYVISLYENESDFKYSSKNINFYGFSGNFLNALVFLFRHIKKESLVFYGHINILPFAILFYLFMCDMCYTYYT